MLKRDTSTAAWSRKTYDGIAIAPLYARDGAARPCFGRVAGTPWQILQRIELPDPSAANAQALHDLQNGADGLTLVFEGAAGARGFALDGAGAIAPVLDGVYLDAGIALDLNSGLSMAEVARGVTDVVRRRGLAAQSLAMRFGFDPIGALARGAPEAPAWPGQAAAFASTVRELAVAGYAGPFAVADGRVIHDAGGSEVLELAYVLATALAYLRALEAGGTALAEARRMLYFRLSADADQFLTTAKFRALRKLWARVEEAERRRGERGERRGEERRGEEERERERERGGGGGGGRDPVSGQADSSDRGWRCW